MCSRRLIYGIASLLILISGTPALAAQNTNETDLRIAVVAHRGLEKAIKRWTPTIDYLARNLPGYNVKIVPTLLNDLQDMVLRKDVDFVIVNPGTFVELENRYGVVALATMSVEYGGNVVSEFGGVIFTRANRIDINDLDDIRGKSLMAVAQNSFGGYQVARRALETQGIDLDSDLSHVLFSDFPQDKVVYAVRDRTADVGTVRTGILESMAAEGLIDLKDFNVLNPHPGTFPLALSTKRYPEWAFAKLAHIPADLTKKIALLLYRIPADAPASRAGKYYGWTTPSSYGEVHRLFRDLGIGPYEKSFDLVSNLREHWGWLAFAALIFSACLLRRHAGAILQSIILRNLNDRGRLAVLALIMAGVAGSVAAIGFVGLYNAAFEQQKNQLSALAKSQKHLIDSITRFDAVHSTDAHINGATAATLTQIDGAFRNFEDSQKGEETILANREGDNIVYLTRSRIQDHALPEPVPFIQSGDTAMFMALNGQSGIIRTTSRQGEEFLVAFEPIPSLKAGLVARLAIKKIQHPFIIAGMLTATGAFVVIILGVFLFRQISSPLIQRLESAIKSLSYAQRITHIGSWNWDISSSVIDWSDEIYRIFGHEPQSIEATYEAFQASIHPKDRQQVQDAVNVALQTGTPYHAEHRIVLPDGNIRHVEERGEVTFSETGDPIYMSGTVNDITDRKLAEQSISELHENLERRVEERTIELEIAIAEHEQTQELLQYSESHMKAIVDSAADGIITISEAGTITGYNTAAENMFGWSATEAIGKNISTLMPQEEAEHHSSYLQHFTQTNEPKIIGSNRELFGVRKDGVEFPLELAVSVNKVGEQRMFTGIIRDISERKKIKRELENKEKRLRDTLNNMPGVIIFTDENAHIVVCNDRYTEMCEVPAELLTPGSSYEDVFRFRAERGDYGSGQVADLVSKRIESLYNPGEEIFEDVIPGGRIHEVRRRPAEGGGVVTVISDITERKLAEEELREALKTLEQAQDGLVQAEKMASLGGLVAGVAHEINTPVGISVTAASHLEEAAEHLKSAFAAGTMKKSDLNAFIDTTEQSTRMICSNLQRAADLIGSFKQVAVDQSSEEKRKFHLSPYLEEILMSLHPQLKKTRHQVAITCNANIELDSYPGALSQVVTNLIMNSLIHGFEKQEEGNIRLSVSESANSIELEYSDNGCGMDSKTLAKIFDPFFTTKRGSGGSGLGMNILYNLIIQTLEGTVSCTSQPGKGAKFLIDIPKQVAQHKPELREVG